VLVTDSFLMKGEEMPPNAVWGGTPAKQMRKRSDDLPARKISVDDNRATVLRRLIPGQRETEGRFDGQAG
jgi:hypothetical protein